MPIYSPLKWPKNDFAGKYSHYLLSRETLIYCATPVILQNTDSWIDTWSICKYARVEVCKHVPVHDLDKKTFLPVLLNVSPA